MTGQTQGPVCLLAPEAHLGGHAVGDAEGQVLQYALHAVVVLLPCGAKVLLQRPGHGGEDGLGCLSGVHHLPGSFLLFLSLETLDMDEGFFYCHHQSGRRLGTVSRQCSSQGGQSVRPQESFVHCSTLAYYQLLQGSVILLSLAVLQGMGGTWEKEKQQQK